MITDRESPLAAGVLCLRNWNLEALDLELWFHFVKCRK